MSHRPPAPLTAAEAAHQLRTTPWEVTLLCRAGRIKATKPGKKWLIEQADLDAYKAAHSNQQPAEAVAR